ncbi:YolD-like family protein, partial [Bacillus mycoides]|uniref:YolD-like family protein n=1 Tax=Bacillus mycoides TaxID=1405 RepID=UPI0003E25A17|nr:hypothetical protein C174_04648 [Bacillus mycoides FSL H7-687]
MVKRRSFASLPEQFIRINEMLNELNKALKPIVKDDLHEELERELIHSMQTHEEILILY